MNKQKISKKGMAYTQSVLLLFGLIATAFIIGGMGLVNAAGENNVKLGDDCDDIGQKSGDFICGDNKEWREQMTLSQGGSQYNCESNGGVCSMFCNSQYGGTPKLIGTCPNGQTCCNFGNLDYKAGDENPDPDEPDVNVPLGDKPSTAGDRTSESNDDNPISRILNEASQGVTLANELPDEINKLKDKLQGYKDKAEGAQETIDDASDAVESAKEIFDTKSETLKEAMAELDNLDKGTEEYKELESAIEKLESQVETAELNLEYSKSLETIMSERQAIVDDANKAVTAAETKLNKAISSGADKETINAAEKAVKEAKKAARDAEIQTTMGGVGFIKKYGVNFWTKQPFKGAEGANGYSMGTGGYIIGTAITAAASAALVFYAFKVFGTGERNLDQIQSAAIVSASAITLYAGLGKIAGLAATALPSFGVTAIVVAGATLAWAAISYQNFAQESFTYSASLWQPPTGGENCQSCDDLPYGCSEYQCKSMGAGCELLNKGTNYEECDWVNENDMNPPLVSQLDILDVGFEYNPDEDIQLPDRGVKILYTGQEASMEQCMPAFTGLKFGVKTDEPAQCKIDLERKRSFDNLLSYMQEGSVYTYNHTISLPSSAFPSEYAMNQSNWSIEAGKDHSFYVRCMDRNGNENTAHFVMSFCVDDGPDTTAPTIETNYLSGAYVAHDVDSIDDLEVYTNEPADCRWDRRDVSYEEMKNYMKDCSTQLGVYTFPSKYQYGCRAEVDGILPGQENNFYIRCKDKPGLDETDSKERRIANQESHLLTLVGTNELAIQEIKINEEENGSTFYESISPMNIKLNVITSQGAEKNGNARCSYSPAEEYLYYEFYNRGNFGYTPNNVHNMHLYEGYYGYSIRCCDVAGNCDNEEIEFEVNIDDEEPEITRTYFEEDYLKITTSEAAECVYSTNTCNYLFEDGLTFDTIDNFDHFNAWDTESTLFIKCKDSFDNTPSPDECQLIARPFEEFEQTNSTL